jgi:hypothetical protein
VGRYHVEYREGVNGIFSNDWTDEQQASLHAHHYLAGSDAYKLADRWHPLGIDLDIRANQQPATGTVTTSPKDSQLLGVMLGREPRPKNESKVDKIIRQLVRADYYQFERVSLTNLSDSYSAGEYLRDGLVSRVISIVYGVLLLLFSLGALLLVTVVPYELLLIAFGQHPMRSTEYLLAVIGAGLLSVAYLVLFRLMPLSGTLFMIRHFFAKRLQS